MSGRACCRACRRYNRVAIEVEEEQQERVNSISLPPPRHYFRGVALRRTAVVVLLVVMREHVARQHSLSTERTTARLHAWINGAGVCKSAPP